MDNVLEGEMMEIEGIIGLAKADKGVKNILLQEVISEFGDEIEQMWYEYFSEQGMIR